MKIAYFSLGCFWGPQLEFEKIKGVKKTEVGYCGGDDPNTTYEKVCSGSTNHAETVKVEFDDKVVSYQELVRFFFKTHDPTQLNRQGPDIGSQYRSEIFCLNEDQYLLADSYIRQINVEKYNNKIVTAVSMAKSFWIAEEYHQKYIRKKRNMIL